MLRSGLYFPNEPQTVNTLSTLAGKASVASRRQKKARTRRANQGFRPRETRIDDKTGFEPATQRNTPLYQLSYLPSSKRAG